MKLTTTTALIPSSQSVAQIKPSEISSNMNLDCPSALRLGKYISALAVAESNLHKFTDSEEFIFDVEICFDEDRSDVDHGNLMLELDALKNRMKFLSTTGNIKLSSSIMESLTNDMSSLFAKLEEFLVAAESLPTVAVQLVTSTKNPMVAAFKEIKYIANILLSVFGGELFAMNIFNSTENNTGFLSTTC